MQKQEAFKFAVDLGVGMQMTNIARDVFEDSNLDRRYLPGTWIDSMTAREIRDCSQHPHSDNYRKIKIAIDRILNLAQEYYDSGRLGLSYLPYVADLELQLPQIYIKASATKSN